MIYRLIARTVTSPKLQGSEVLLDWMKVISTFFNIPNQNDILEKR